MSVGGFSADCSVIGLVSSSLLFASASFAAFLVLNHALV
jgi:hypothetical protein